LAQESREMNKALAKIEQRVNKMPVIEQNLSTFDQEERVLSGALDNMSNRLIESQLKEAETMSNVFITDPPTLPYKSAFPSRPHVLLVGALIGLWTAYWWVSRKHKPQTEHVGFMKHEFDVPLTQEESFEMVQHNGNGTINGNGNGNGKGKTQLEV